MTSLCDMSETACVIERARWTHTVDVTQGCGWCVGRWGEGGEGHRTHRGLTTSENRLGLKIKHYVIGVGV